MTVDVEAKVDPALYVHYRYIIVLFAPIIPCIFIPDLLHSGNILYLLLGKNFRCNLVENFQLFISKCDYFFWRLFMLLKGKGTQ